jgi:hypothetical protein
MSLKGQLESKFNHLLPHNNYESRPIQTRRVKILAAAIKTLVATPVELVAAPGLNKLIEFLGAILVLSAGTEVLTESTDNLIIDYDDGSGITVSTVEATGFIDQTVDTLTRAVPVKDAIAANSAAVNKNLAILNNSGEYAGNSSGDAQLDVYVSFRIIELN